jgi:choline dehydrogenase-like flavoprotein
LFFDRTTKSERRVAGAAVVVAAGPLNSTRLLLNSQSPDFPAGLGNTQGILGRFLHDHPKDWCTVELSRPLTRLGHAAYLTRAPHRSSEPLLAASFTFGPASPRDRILSSMTPIKTTSFGLVTFGTMIPTERSYVRLHPQEKDELGMPQLDIHIRFGDDVSRTIAAARERLLAIMKAAGYRCSIHCTLPRLVPGSSAHYGGTVRMHGSPKYGMVDGWNRLHAVNNVAVVDASTFTTGVEKNPTLTAMALAARAAERLAHDLKAGLLGSRLRLAHAV